MANNFILNCPDLNGERIKEMKENIESWLKTPILKKLVNAFEGEIPERFDLSDLSKWLLDFSDCWDFRSKQKQAFDSKVGEGVRWLVTDNGLSDEQKSLAFVAASELGLRDNFTPSIKDFDYVWVLGGAKLSCLLRSRLAHDAIKNMTHSPKAVIMLASMRPIGDAEREATNTYAPDAETEYDLFIATAQQEFNVNNDFNEERHDDIENANSSWVVRKYPVYGYDVYIIAAPSSDPQKRRANSADTYEFFFNRFQAPKGSSILLTTSQIYAPYQHLEAVRTIAIPHIIYLDTIGFPPEWGGALQGMNSPSNYLQEIRSTIQAISRFLSFEHGGLGELCTENRGWARGWDE